MSILLLKRARGVFLLLGFSDHANICNREADREMHSKLHAHVSSCP